MSQLGPNGYGGYNLNVWVITIQVWLFESRMANVVICFLKSRYLFSVGVKQASNVNCRSRPLKLVNLDLKTPLESTWQMISLVVSKWDSIESHISVHSLQICL